MSTPVIEQQPPPVVEVAQQAYTAHSGHRSVGPVIAVLAVITILGMIAGMIGRLCSGRRTMGRQYDFEGWFERKCSSCIDGNIDPIQPSAIRPEIPVAEPVVVEEPQAQQQEQEKKGKEEHVQEQEPVQGKQES